LCERVRTPTCFLDCFKHRETSWIRSVSFFNCSLLQVVGLARECIPSELVFTMRVPTMVAADARIHVSRRMPLCGARQGLPCPSRGGGRMCMLAAFFFEGMKQWRLPENAFAAGDNRSAAIGPMRLACVADGISERYYIKYMKRARSVRPTDLCSAYSGIPSMSGRIGLGRRLVTSSTPASWQQCTTCATGPMGTKLDASFPWRKVCPTTIDFFRPIPRAELIRPKWDRRRAHWTFTSALWMKVLHQ
jgi:hypothetical protein